MENETKYYTEKVGAFKKNIYRPVYISGGFVACLHIATTTLFHSELIHPRYKFRYFSHEELDLMDKL